MASNVEGGGVSNSIDQVNILIIEDDQVTRRQLSEFLTRHQHQVLVASSTEEGLVLLPEWTFHVAFVDHHLPGMHGLILGEYLRHSNPEM